MYRLSIERTRKQKSKLCRAYRRRLEKMEQIACSERRMIQFDSSNNILKKPDFLENSSNENHDLQNYSDHHLDSEPLVVVTPNNFNNLNTSNKIPNE